MSSNDEPLARLRAWGEANGVRLHPSLQLQYLGPEYGNGLTVRPDSRAIEPGEPLVQCSLHTTLSYLNATGALPSHHPTASTSASSPYRLPQKFLDEAAPHVIGRYFLISEYLRGSDSFWYPYISLLPQPSKSWKESDGKVNEHDVGKNNGENGKREVENEENGDNSDTEEDSEEEPAWVTPPFWSASERARLGTTNAGVAIAQLRQNFKAEHAAAVRLLRKAYADAAAATTTNTTTSGPSLSAESAADVEESVRQSRGFYSRTLHEWAFSVYSARCFQPEAVMSRRTLRGLLRTIRPALSSAPDLAPLPGAAATKESAFGVLVPVLDLVNHDPYARLAWRLACKEEWGPLAGSAGTHAQSGGGDGGAEGDQTLLLRILVTPFTRHVPGEQVHSSYGPKTNAELLVSYGFVATFAPDNASPTPSSCPCPTEPRRHNAYFHLQKRSHLTRELNASPISSSSPFPSASASFFLASLQPVIDGSAPVDNEKTTANFSQPSNVETQRFARVVPRPQVTVEGFSRLDHMLLWDMLLQVYGEDIEKLCRDWEVEVPLVPFGEPNSEGGSGGGKENEDEEEEEEQEEEQQEEEGLAQENELASSALDTKKPVGHIMSHILTTYPFPSQKAMLSIQTVRKILLDFLVSKRKAMADTEATLAAKMNGMKGICHGERARRSHVLDVYLGETALVLDRVVQELEEAMESQYDWMENGVRCTFQDDDA